MRAIDEVRPPFLIAGSVGGAFAFVGVHVLLGPPWTLLVAAVLPFVVVGGVLWVQLCWDLRRTR